MTTKLKYLVIDLETSVNNVGDDAIGTHKSNPFHPDNKIVVMGYKADHFSSVVFKLSHSYASKNLFEDIEWLVGHNIKFDILYLMRYYKESWDKFIQSGGRIWDTQLAEYILSGQTHLYPSLNECAIKYGGTVKDERIKEYWDNGIRTEDIPQDQLMEYAKYDVLNTELIFIKQVHDAYDNNMLDLLKAEMEALLCTTEMEFNGMYFDVESANKEKRLLEIERQRVVRELVLILEHIFPKEYNFNVSSNDDISKVLFGGEVKYFVNKRVEDENGIPILYKSGNKKGQFRYRKKEVVTDINGFGISPREEWKTSKPGVYQVNDTVLQELKGRFSKDAREFIELLLKNRELSKEIKTYYEGYSKLVWQDNCIHPNFNHCATATGRLSCSSPNIQNAKG